MTYSRKQEYGRNFSEKRQRNAKYNKIWAKMYKICKYLEKGLVISCNNHVQ